MNIPLLEREHEQSLARRWREDGDEKALHELVTPYLRLVISTAGRFRTYGLPIGDLVQEGNIGLMQAAARFDPDRNVRFSTIPRGGFGHRCRNFQPSTIAGKISRRRRCWVAG